MCAPRIGVAYLAPYGRHHEIASVVAVADEAENKERRRSVDSTTTKRGASPENGCSRESRFGHLDPWSVKILLQTGIELGQATVLEVGNTLLLVLDISPGSKFVSGHGDGDGGEP